MAMGIVSDKDFEKAKEDASQNRKPAIPTINGNVVTIERGRGTGNVEVPDALRKVIGDSHVVDGRSEAIALAKNFGISPSSASAYANGATSTSTYNDKPNGHVINAAKDRVIKKARVKLMSALSHITDEKLEGAKARDLAGIAKDMSAVIKTMEPDTPKSPGEGDSKGPTFIFYAPQFRKEESYDTVYAKD